MYEVKFLNGAVKRFESFNGVDLEAVNFRDKNLKCLDFSMSNMAFADLRNADLSFSRLFKTNLTFANLTNANINKANLTEVDISGAVGIESFGPTSVDPRIGYVVLHNNCIMVKFGCFWGELTEFLNRIKDKNTKFQVTNSAYILETQGLCY